LTARRQSRSYAPQWIMVSDIAARLGVDESAVQDTAAVVRVITPGRRNV
jgi:hypothetical protein